MIHERAREAALPVECKKDSLRQNQDGTWKLVLTIAPDGLPDPIMKAPPGVRYQCAFVEVDDTEEPIKHTQRPSERPRTPFHEKPYSVQAGIRCSDERFWNFLADRHGWATGSEAAANYVRITSNVDSRADLDHQPDAAQTWEALNAEFEQWAGMVPEKR